MPADRTYPTDNVSNDIHVAPGAVKFRNDKGIGPAPSIENGAQHPRLP